MPTIKQFRGNYDKRYYKKEEVDTLLSDGTISHLNLSNIGVNTHAQIDTHIADIDIFISAMVGALQMYGGAVAPAGWLNCDGASLLRAGTYADLFAVIGVTYGSADGTHFNVPDLKGRVPLGLGDGDAIDHTDHTLAEKEGTETHTLTIAQMPAHTHGLRENLHQAGTGSARYSDGARVTGSTGGDEAHNNLQPSLTLNFIIKY